MCVCVCGGGGGGGGAGEENSYVIFHYYAMLSIYLYFCTHTEKVVPCSSGCSGTRTSHNTDSVF